MNKKVFLLTVLICTPIGLMWNWWHYKYGIIPAWSFGPAETLGLLICDVPFVDWVFYPVTGAFFVTMIMIDPLKGSYGLFLSNDMVANFINKNYNTITNTFYIFLIHLTSLGILVFGESGTRTALTFGVPSLLMWIYISKNINIHHFIRTGIIVVPTNFFWELWATPMTHQWWYNKESGCFSESFWYLGIPFEMTPYLGLMAWYFIFCVVKTIEKVMIIKQ